MDRKRDEAKDLLFHAYEWVLYDPNMSFMHHADFMLKKMKIKATWPSKCCYIVPLDQDQLKKGYEHSTRERQESNYKYVTEKRTKMERSGFYVTTCEFCDSYFAEYCVNKKEAMLRLSKHRQLWPSSGATFNAAIGFD